MQKDSDTPFWPAMPHNRYYYNTPAFSLGTTLSLEHEEAHHLIRVMRARPKDQVELMNGLGELALCTVERIEKEQGFLRINSVHQEPRPTLSVIVALSLLRLNALEWALEKATELGATHFWLFPAARSEKKELSLHQQARLRTIILSACKQCGRLYIPEIIFKQELSSLNLNKETAGMIPLVCDPQAPSIEALMLDTSSQPLILFIGPEGGFTKEETEMFKKVQHTHFIRLHPYILRAETAPLAALSILFSKNLA